MGNSISCGYDRGKEGAGEEEAKAGGAGEEEQVAERLRVAARAASKHKELEGGDGTAGTAAEESAGDDEGGDGQPAGQQLGGPMAPSPRVHDAGPEGAPAAGPEPPSSSHLAASAAAASSSSSSLGGDGYGPPPISEEELLRQYEAELDAVRNAGSKQAGGGDAAASPSAVPPRSADLASRRMSGLSEFSVGDDRGTAESELLSGEHRFRTAMLEGQRLYARPLRDPAERAFLGLSEEEVGRILSHMDTVLKAHEGLYDDLFDEELMTMPEIYARHAPYFEAFTLYAGAVEQALVTLNELGANERLVQFFRLKEASSADGSLLGLLLLPAQHLRDVAAQLDALRSLPGSADAPDAAAMARAADAFAAHATAQAEALTRAENMAGVLEVRFAVGDVAASFANGSRFYVQRAPLTCWRLSADGFNESARYVFFLFSDTLLWTTPKLVLVDQLDLAARPLAARATPSQALRLDLLPAAGGGAAIMSLECASEEERDEWLAAVTRCLEALG